MEVRCSSISKSLKISTQNPDRPPEINQRLQSLRGMITRISHSHLQSSWAETFLDSCEIFIKNLINSDSLNIPTLVTCIENDLLRNLVSDLNIPDDLYHNILNNLINPEGRSLKLCEMLPKFISIYLKMKFNQETVARCDFENEALAVFQSFQIPYNFYVIGLANKYFQNKYSYNLKLLDLFLELFFGSIENYKFYVKVARCVELFAGQIDKGQFFHNGYKITLSQISLDYTGGNHTMQEGDTFNVKPLGLLSLNYRGDQLIIFGRHKGADISFPSDDRSIDYAAFILFNTDKNIIALDISRKNSCMIKIENGINFILEKEMIINLAKTLTLYVSQIQFDEDSAVSNEINSALILECLEGFYIGCIFYLNTKTNNSNTKKLKFLFGSGIGEDACDVFIPGNSGVSRKHLDLTFNQESLSWQINDTKSSNGTYLYLKNATQFRDKNYSQEYPLLEDISQSINKTIMIGKYSFLIKTS